MSKDYRNPRPEDRDRIDRIIRESKRETRISYELDGSFFTPRLRGINHAELGRSKMIENPVTIVAEALLLEVEKYRYFVQDAKDTLFPRTERIYGSVTDTRVVGNIASAGPRDVGIPIHNLEVQLWARTHWGQWRLLGGGRTDRQGDFALGFDLRAARSPAVRSIRLEIYQITHIFFEQREARPKYEIYRTIEIPKAEITGMDYSLGDIQLHLWEYRTDTPVPRVVIPEDKMDLPQKYSQGRLNAFYNQILPIELTKLKHLEQIRHAPHTIDLEAIQRDYPENLTRCIERKLPGYTRGDAWFGRRIMNGMNKGTFEPDPTEEGVYWVKYFGVCGYEHNDLYALPTCRVRFTLDGEGLPLPREIRLQGKLTAFDTDPDREVVLTPADQPDWEYAKRVVRTCGAVSAEVDEHFTGTHLNTEQYAIAAYRNLRLSPIATLLLPHLKEVVLINHAAETSLITGYLPRATALTARGLDARIHDVMGVLDWKGWKPMRALSLSHTYARGEQLFWEVTGRYVDTFIDRHLDEIKTHWYEVYQFSEDLVNHSVEVYTDRQPDPQNNSPAAQLERERLAYYRRVYNFSESEERREVAGRRRVVTPITSAPDFAATGPDDLNHLREVCRYIIMTATFLHTWINEHQYDDLGEILYSGGGLRFGDKPDGVMRPESDRSIAPDPQIATEMLWFTNFLSRTEYGFITRNEEDDVNPLFRKFLLEEEKKFARLGIDIHAIESRTNI